MVQSEFEDEEDELEEESDGDRKQVENTATTSGKNDSATDSKSPSLPSS